MRRLSNIGILITSLFGYMEWGANNDSFLFEAQYEILFGHHNFIESITHPIILFSISGQLLILHCAIKNNSSKKTNIAGLILLSLIMLLIILGGSLSSNTKMILSTVPFLFFAALLIIAIKKERPKASL
ncbi:hypothetical protein [Flavobacterium pedocola]